jgi:hypothetical protein
VMPSSVGGTSVGDRNLAPRPILRFAENFPTSALARLRRSANGGMVLSTNDRSPTAIVWSSLQADLGPLNLGNAGLR